MFSFFKKKKVEINKNNNSNNIKMEMIQIDKEIDKEEVLNLIEQKKKVLEESTENKEIELLNEIAENYFKISELDLAIEFYEKSLNKNKKIGKVSTELMNLYNLKRKEASLEKNDKKVAEYMEKINELMQLSKDSLRGKI